MRAGPRRRREPLKVWHNGGMDAQITGVAATDRGEVNGLRAAVLIVVEHGGILAAVRLNYVQACDLIDQVSGALDGSGAPASDR